MPRRRVGGKRARSEAPLEAVHFRAQLARLRVGTPRGTTPFALPEPGGTAADDDTADQEHQHQEIERQRPREGGVGLVERIEGDNNALAIGHRKADDDDRERKEDQRGDNPADHDLRRSGD